MTLEVVYWLTLGVGLGMLALSVLLGGVLDVFDVELGGNDLAMGPVLFAATAAFGAGGLLGIRAFGLGPGASSVLGLTTGVIFGAATGMLFVMLRKQEAAAGFSLDQLIGRRGRCTVSVGPDQVGQVSVTADGMTRSFTALADESIAVGDEIVVRAVVSGTVKVARPPAGAS